MDIIDRLQLLIEKERLTIPTFARKIGVNDQTIRGIVVQRRNKPGYDLLVKILQTFDWLNPEWLLLGEGNMDKDPPPEEVKKTDIPSGSFSIKEYMDYVREKDEVIQQLIEEKTYYKIEYERLLQQIHKK